MRCCVKACKNHTGRKVKGVDGITFHVFPNDEEIKKRWVEVVDRDGWNPSKYSIICSAHFKEEEFYDTKKGLRRLQVGTVPSLNMGSESGVRERAPNRKRGTLSDDPGGENYAPIDGRTAAETPSGRLRLGSGELRVDVETARPALQRELLSDLQRLSNKVQRLYPAVRGKPFTLTYRGEDGDKCEYVFTSSSETRRSGVRHNSLGCNECGVDIVGFRYKCVSCADYDLCAACETIGAHAQHVVMRIARPIKFRHSRNLVARWCEAMHAAGLGSLDEITAPVDPLPAHGGPGQERSGANVATSAAERRGEAVVKSEVASPATIPPREATKGVRVGRGGRAGRSAQTPRSPSGEHKREVKVEAPPAEDSSITASGLYNEPTLAVDEVKVEEPDPLMDTGEEATVGSVPGIRAHGGNIVIDCNPTGSAVRQNNLAICKHI